MSLRRKTQIYSAARSLFRERGYSATTMRDIARETKMLVGSLYTHIDSKEDVLWEIVSRAADQFLDAAEPIAASKLSPADKLQAMIRAHVHLVAGNLDEATIFLHEWKFLGETRREAVAASRRRYESLYRQVIEQGMDSGDFAATDSKMATVMVLSAVNWLPQWYNPSGPLSPDEIADSFFELVFLGLREDPSTAISVDDLRQMARTED
jgi:AcrR family transcriptional regulator